ncbi:serine hydrolase [Lysinibacillus odysseyi]|uniref:Beta-lactamase class A catalytic domain-containing protein n=1 Tax=Lysinibacillus odysseyi 34hs-1 = NBRC 100172 TaxID=1220589 RepID=A0A0A3IBQ1_9BACI|nr:serine hydrolase [Lysinibacillus odysseyi]KGR82164.1 hypothetical protein CD32_23060 [Lysinibacillus odysseyi 34hs-1 = NBRC 100172]
MKYVAAIFIFLLCTAVGLFIWQINKSNPALIYEHVKKQEESGQAALVIKRNGEVIVEVNPTKTLPLASTVKFIVAIAYAEAVADGLLDAGESVPIAKLQNFYIPKTDGGAHQAWLDSLGKVNSIPLKEVANGMMLYSSNANTDYLIYKIGLENINNLIKKLGLSQHEELYPLVSALYIPVQLIQERGIEKKQLAAALEKMDMEEYRKRAMDIHTNWLTQSPSKEDIKHIQQYLTADVQKVWSDRLPRATAAEYASLMAKLNSKDYFPPKVHANLDPITEQLMQNPQNQSWLRHAGQKGGSTKFVLTKAMYATDKQENQTEIVLLLNELSFFEQIILSRNLNAFQLKVLSDPAFIKKMKKTIENRPPSD